MVNKGGRPPLPAEERKSKKVEIRLTPDDKLNWKMAPEHSALTMSEFWRGIVNLLAPVIKSFYYGEITEDEFKDYIGSKLLSWINEAPHG